MDGTLSSRVDVEALLSHCGVLVHLLSFLLTAASSGLSILIEASAVIMQDSAQFVKVQVTEVLNREQQGLKDSFPLEVCRKELLHYLKDDLIVTFHDAQRHLRALE